MKKNLLFVTSRLSVGGAQKSMLKALSVLDYSKYDVTLYVRENRTDLLSDVPNSVNVIINDDRDYKYRLIPIFYEVLRRLGCIFKIHKLKTFAEERSNEYIVKSRYKYEKNNYFSNGIIYDIAVSYMNGYVCEFVADYVEAKRKVCFYLESSNESPQIHSRCLPMYDLIVTDSEGTKDFLVNTIMGISDKFSVIHNFVDYLEVREKAKELLSINSYNEKKVVLCSCGRFVAVKGFDLAIEAARILKEKSISFIWYFVGGGPQKLKLVELIEKYGLKDSIIITGIVSNPYPYINNCDIYVQPSYEESYGLTITEARILYKPIVSTNTIGGKYQIKDMIDGILTGFTGSDIANGIIHYLNNGSFMNTVINNLKMIDYTRNNEIFRTEWEKVLED